MKKLIVFAVVAVLAVSAFGQAADWIGNSYIYANDTWYLASGVEGWATGGAFHGADLGTITSLLLGGQIQSSGDDDGANNPASMSYSIDGGTFVSTELTWYKYAIPNNYFQTGGDPLTALEVDISSLAAGPHTLAIYFSKPSLDTAEAPDGNLYDNNYSINYHAYFTVGTAPAVPEPATMSLLGLGALAMVLRRKLRK